MDVPWPAGCIFASPHRNGAERKLEMQMRKSERVDSRGARSGMVNSAVKAADTRAGGPVVGAGMLGGGLGALIGALLLGPLGAVVGSAVGAALLSTAVVDPKKAS